MKQTSKAIQFNTFSGIWSDAGEKPLSCLISHFLYTFQKKMRCDWILKKTFIRLNASQVHLQAPGFKESSVFCRLFATGTPALFF